MDQVKVNLSVFSSKIRSREDVRLFATKLSKILPLTFFIDHYLPDNSQYGAHFFNDFLVGKKKVIIYNNLLLATYIGTV